MLTHEFSLTQKAVTNHVICIKNTQTATLDRQRPHTDNITATLDTMRGTIDQEKPNLNTEKAATDTDSYQKGTVSYYRLSDMYFRRMKSYYKHTGSFYNHNGSYYTCLHYLQTHRQPVHEQTATTDTNIAATGTETAAADIEGVTLNT